MARYTLEVRTGKLSGSYCAGFSSQKDAISGLTLVLYSLGATLENIAYECAMVKGILRSPGFHAHTYAPFNVEWSVVIRRHSKV